MSDETGHALREVTRTKALLVAREAREVAIGLRAHGGTFASIGERFDQHADVIVELLAELRRVAP